MFFMNAVSELNLSNPAYLKTLELYLWGAYQLDIPKKDITTKIFLGSARQTSQAVINSNADGILAGMQEVKWFLERLNLKITQEKKDGSPIKKGDIILKLEGRASSILGAERTLLNFLQRMSGVATKAKKMRIKLPKSIKLLSTRKTLWGMLDKRAASLGGAFTHRLNLSDAILVKENHIALSQNFQLALKRIIKKSSKIKFVEIELESIKEVENFLEIYKKQKKFLKEESKFIVMLDNFNLRDLKKVIHLLKNLGIFVEVSGGINEKNIIRYAISGVSAISSGAITSQAGNLDMSLDFINE